MRTRNVAAAGIAVLALAGCGSATASDTAASRPLASHPAHAVDTAASSVAMTAACRIYLRDVGSITVAGTVAPARVGKLLGSLETLANQGSSGPDRNAVAKAFGAASLDYFLNGTRANMVHDITIITTACRNAH